MKHLELFAGIGGFRRAIDLLAKDNNMDIDCVGYSEIESNAVKTYCSNYHVGKEEIALGDIVSYTADEQNIEQLPNFDLLTGGFPCQTFSMMGKQAGFNEDRGQLFFRIIDILKVKKPRYVLLENVKNLRTHDKGRTFLRIKKELESLGYTVISDVFNTADFHLPQTRNRVLIFATLDKLSSEQVDDFSASNVAALFDEIYKDASVLKFESTLDVLAKTVDKKYYLSERIKPTILSDGSANFKSRSEINMQIARPLTASMHKMHRACQDNYYSQDFIDSKGKINEANILSKEALAKLPIRRLTPEEAFMLQGFDAEFVRNARKHKVSDGALYKQAGNAVSVNTIYAVLYYLITNKYMSL
jgi:DNA (cytosine-5)-methyltransferase 1